MHSSMLPNIVVISNDDLVDITFRLDRYAKARYALVASQQRRSRLILSLGEERR